MSVNYGGGWGVFDNLERRARHDVAALGPVNVCGYLDDAVRVVSGEVCADGVSGYYLGFLLARAHALEKLGGYELRRCRP